MFLRSRAVAVEVWTQDCGVENYDSAPSDGSAQQSPACERHTLRGSSWNFSPTGFRSAHREDPPTAGRSSDTGLRVAEDVPNTQISGLANKD